MPVVFVLIWSTGFVVARLAMPHAPPFGFLAWRFAISVLAFVLGDEARGASPKFVGSRSLLERCVVALATNRGLMLIGEPGTAKSLLSELICAAISGCAIWSETLNKRRPRSSLLLGADDSDSPWIAIR